MILEQMPADHYLYLALNFALGIGVGAYGTLVGAGGGFLLVPIFLLLHHLPHGVAVGTSLVVVAANALSGTLGYVRDRKIDYRAGVLFALCTFPGAVAGGLSVNWVSGPTFQKIFGALLSAVALYLFLRREKNTAAKPRGPGRGWVHRESYSYFETGGMVGSVGVGAISSWFGIGGGIIHVPLMTELLGFPVSIAVATSHFILGFTALVGATVHVAQGQIDWRLALPIGLGALFGAQIGILLSRRAKGSWVLRALSLALLLVGIRLLWG